jgi:hypothetical protein
MKRFLVCVAALSCLLVVGSSSTMAQCNRGGGPGFGVSLNYGGGYNNFGGYYNQGYSQPYYGGGYPAYRSVQIYSTPVYGGGYFGGGYNRGFGGGYGHHHHHHH